MYYDYNHPQSVKGLHPISIRMNDMSKRDKFV